VAVRVVDREVVVEVPQVHVVPAIPRLGGCAPALHQLAHQLDTGRFYDRDLPELLRAVEVLLAALSRRPAPRRPRQRPLR